MAPPRKPRAKNEKAVERGKLAKLREITITIQASENNLQRLGALLLFADHLEPELVEINSPLPWEDPNDPQYQKPPELQIDYEAVRRSIIKHLSAYVARYDEDRARAVIKSYGAERLSLVAEDQLLPLNAALEAALSDGPPAGA